MNEQDLVMNGKYNFEHQPERLEFVGWDSGWAEFVKIGYTTVWAQVQASDLWMIEESVVDIGTEGHYDYGKRQARKFNPFLAQHGAGGAIALHLANHVDVIDSVKQDNNDFIQQKRQGKRRIY
jgi:hypothetical protein